MTRVLVTGANGFIGSHLVRELLRRGYQVSGLVRHTSNLAPLRGLPLSLFIGDVREPDTLVAAVQGVDYIYHLAAALMVTSREAFEETNTQGTRHMLEVAEAHAGSTLERFLFVSSQAAAGPSADSSPIDETAEPNPVSWYGTSKQQAEALVRSFADRLPVTIVRPSAVYGAREKEISQGFPLVEAHLHPVMGWQTKHAVMVYVGDLVQGMIAAAESERARHETYFLNHPQVLTTRDVIKTIALAMEKPWGLTLPTPIPLVRLAAPLAELAHHFTRLRPQVTRDKVRELACRYWVADPGKARRDFDWEAEHDLLSGMKITTDHFRHERAELLEMPLEARGMLWVKYVICALLLGALIEITSALGQFYTFDSRWLGFVAVIGFFGLTLGTIAMWLRKRSTLLQLVVGTALAGSAELFNELGLIPFGGWTFTPGWPLGITNVWLRALVLGFAGGIFIIVVNGLLQVLYKRRLRLG